MKQILLFAIIAAVILDSFENMLDDMTNWEFFKAEYGKKYKTNREETRKRKIFLANLEFIQEHNQKFEKGEVTFTLGANKFADMTNEEFNAVMNGHIHSPLTNMTDEILPKKKYKSLPKRKDWRKKGAVTHVMNQGMCDASWAFSAVGSIEGQYFRKNKRLVPLSVQNIIDCSNEEGNRACRSGLMSNAFSYVIRNKGINTEESYPYKGGVGFCTFKPDKVGATVTGFKRLPAGDENALQVAIAKRGPISVAIDGSAITFQLYKSGVYNSGLCSSTELNRGLLAVGYGHNKTGGDYYIVKNSWGTSWGMDGYIMIARNSNNECGIANLASYPII